MKLLTITIFLSTILPHSDSRIKDDFILVSRERCWIVDSSVCLKLVLINPLEVSLRSLSRLVLW